MSSNSRTSAAPASVASTASASVEANPGKALAFQKLFDEVYAQLRAIAQRQMSEERKSHTWRATELVHEAYLRLAGSPGADYSDRALFFYAAAEAMRRILIERARARLGPNRGGNLRKLPMDVVELATSDDPEQILAIDEAISRLEKRDAHAARMVKLRFYGGLSIEETAESLGVSPRTVTRKWTFARAFLFRSLEGG